MEVVAHGDREEFTLPGIAHRTLPGGFEGTDLWLQTMEPGEGALRRTERN